MRITTLIALVIFLGLNGLSQAQTGSGTLQEQYEAASAAFMGSIDLRQTMDFTSIYPTLVFSGIEGQWAPIGWFGGPSTMPGGLEAFCAKQKYTIKIENPVLLSFEELDGTPYERRVLYQSLVDPFSSRGSIPRPS